MFHIPVLSSSIAPEIELEDGWTGVSLGVAVKNKISLLPGIESRLSNPRSVSLA
jgi:hypothetical protein